MSVVVDKKRGFGGCDQETAALPAFFVLCVCQDGFTQEGLLTANLSLSFSLSLRVYININIYMCVYIMYVCIKRGIS